MMEEKQEVVIFDLEATCDERETGKAPYDNETIEIGAIKLLNGEYVDKLDIYIKPKRTEVTKFCTSLTGITAEKLEKDGISYEEALDKFKEFCQGAEVIYSWGYYDRKQLEKDSKINGYELGKLLENHRSLKHMHGEMQGVRPMGVTWALKGYGLTFKGRAHNGYDDAWNIGQIYNAMVKNEPFRGGKKVKKK